MHSHIPSQQYYEVGVNRLSDEEMETRRGKITCPKLEREGTGIGVHAFRLQGHQDQKSKRGAKETTLEKHKWQLAWVGAASPGFSTVAS